MVASYFVLLATTQAAVGQFGHSDIELAINGDKLITNQRVYRSLFPTVGISKQFSSNPGFAAESDGMGTLGARHDVVYDVLDGLFFWNGQTFVTPDPDVRIRIDNNPPGSHATIIDAQSGMQLGSVDPLKNRVGVSTDNGELHSHVNFILEPTDADVTFGAYGIKLAISTESDVIVNSDPVFVVFNYGLEALTFEEGLSAYEALLNSKTIVGDFNRSGDLDAGDIDLLTSAVLDQLADPEFDVNADGQLNASDRERWVNVLRGTYFGDADLDGEFSSSDLVAVLVVGEYEDEVVGNSTWQEGDWRGDLEFDSSDIVFALQFGGYELGPRVAVAAVPEPNALILLAFGLLATISRVRSGGARSDNRDGRCVAAIRILHIERTTLMKTWLVLTMMCVAAFGIDEVALAQAGHSDIEFAYEGGKIVVEFGDEGAVFEGEFPTDGIDLQFTAKPGFASEIDEGLGIGADDQILYNVLGDLLYWNDGFKAVPNDAQIRIVNRPPSPLVSDTVVGGATGAQPGDFDPAKNRIGAGEADGDFHSDLDFFLEPKGDGAESSMFGAYGFMLSLGTDAVGVDESDPFAMVFNFGLDEAQFETSVEAFANLVPEPTGTISIALSIVGCVVLIRRTCKQRFLWGDYRLAKARVTRWMLPSAYGDFTKVIGRNGLRNCEKVFVRDGPSRTPRTSAVALGELSVRCALNHWNTPRSGPSKRRPTREPFKPRE